MATDVVVAGGFGEGLVPKEGHDTLEDPQALRRLNDGRKPDWGPANAAVRSNGSVSLPEPPFGKHVARRG